MMKSTGRRKKKPLKEYLSSSRPSREIGSSILFMQNVVLISHISEGKMVKLNEIMFVIAVR